MPTYVQPQMRIYQQFEAALAAGLTPLYACVVGPQYGLHRHSVAAEKASLGAYDSTTDTTYAYPGKQAGSAIETGTVKVWADDASLRYYNGSGFAVPSGTAAGMNKIRAAALVLKTANGYDRSAAFGTRDVAVGDKVTVSWTGGSSGSVDTKVSGFIAETVASVGSATAFSGNQTDTGAVAPNITSSSILLTPTAGGTYDGLAAGHVNETYTVTCTKAGGTGVAEVRVVSGSGTDDQALVVMTFAGTNIGTRGVTLALSSGNMVLGDYVVISAQQSYAHPHPTSGGSYAGPSNTNYIVRIVSGGVVDTDDIVYKVETDTGVDVQGETTLSAAGAAIIGNYGVTMTFTTATQYCGGDIWTIAALADTSAQVRTLILADKLVDGASSCAVGDTLTTTLSLVDTVQLPAAYVTAVATTVEVSSTAIVTGTYLGTTGSFPVLAGDLYVEYRELLQTNTATLNSLTSVVDVESTLGPVVTDNPLAYGVYKALENSNGTDVYYIGVPTDDITGYTTALDVVDTNRVVYSLVPCSKDAAVKALFKASVLAASAPEINNWRVTWLNSSQTDLEGVYVSEGGSDIMATITDPLSGTNYVQLLATGARFVTEGVEAGDTVRYGYATQSGAVTYKTALVDAVVSEDELTLLASVDQAYPTAIKVEIWRLESAGTLAGQIAAESGALMDRRVRNVWPDELEDSAGNTVPGYYLCCALAGLRSASAPHAPLTNVSVSGFSSPVSRSTMFTNSQLNTIAGGGTWIVTSDLSGNIYTRHQVTTDNTDLYHREDSITTNCDSVSRIFRDAFSDLVGRGNVSDEMVNLIRHRITVEAGYIMGLPYSDIIGPQIQGYEVTQLERDPVLLDRIVCKIAPDWPEPLNNLDVYIIVGA